MITKAIKDELTTTFNAARLDGALRTHLLINNCLIRYIAISKPIGLFSAKLGHLLGRLQEIDYTNGKPMISSLVVNSNGFPGEGYFDNARALGITIPETRKAESLFWHSELNKLGVPPNAQILTTL